MRSLSKTAGLRLGSNWPVLAFGLLFLLLVLLKGRFTAFDLRSLCVNALPLALVALGQFLIILSRGVDLSLGPVASVAGALMAIHISDNPAIGLLLPVVAGLSAGLLNGMLIAGIGLPPIIVTLATMSVWQGIALIVLPNPGGAVPSFYQQALIGGFSSPYVGLATLLAWGGIVTWILSTRFGLSLRAIGGDELAAGMSGIAVRGTKIVAYMLGGLLAALGGMYMAVSMSSGSPTVGDGYILTSITAVVIGGIPLTGGHGSPLAVVIGALILTITASLLYFAEVSSFYQSLIDGFILLMVVGSGSGRDFLRSLVSR